MEENECKDKVEMYNLKNKQCQDKFKEHTNKTCMSEIFDSKKDLNILTKKFLKRLDGCISDCFQKNRTTKKGNSKIIKLYEKLHTYKDDIDNKEAKIIEDKIAEETFKKILDETKGMDSESGGFNVGHMWNLKSKRIPKNSDVPTAMRDSSGKLITIQKDIQTETMNYYTKVLRNRDIKEGLENHKKEREDLCKLRLEFTKTVKTPPWSTLDICKALKALKSRKSRDPTNLANEKFSQE